MSKDIQEIIWFFVLFVLIFFLGISIGKEIKERQILRELISLKETSEEIEVIQKARMSIEIIDQHIFITNLEVMASLMMTQDNLYDMGIGGAYIGNGRIVCLPDKVYCLHEVGHAVDEFLRHPSVSEEFKQVVDEYIRMCKNQDMVDLVIDFWCNNFIGYKGVNGNPMDIVKFANASEDDEGFEYGGYGEFYAQMFEISRLNFIPLPESIQVFYEMDWNE